MLDVKIKVEFTLEQATKAQKFCRGLAYSFFYFGARWEWVVNATPRPLYPRERPGTHCTGGWMGLTRLVLLGAENLAPYRDSIPGPSSP